MSLEPQMIAANDTFTSSHRTRRLHVWRTGEGHRAILTSAASKFPPKIVLPPGVVAPAAGIHHDAGDIGEYTLDDIKSASRCR